MQNTTNYSLPTWEQDDQIKMSDFNALTAKLDAALKSNADALASEQSAREAAVAAKADASALTAEASAREAADSALAKNLGAAGHNARIAWGSYTGSGKFGPSNPNTLTFGFCPVLVVIAVVTESTVKNPSVFFRGRGIAASLPGGSNNTNLKLTWADSAVSWYNTEAPATQLNAAAQYAYVVLGYDKTAEEA